jgi:hypothetical protein
MTTSIEAEVEAQILNAVTASGVTGIYLYSRERDGQRTLPYVYASAEITAERFEQFTGIFSCSASVRYTARADTSSNQGFDNKFQQVLQAFYTSPNIASQMTSASTSVTFFLANVRQVNPIVSSPTRTWSREIIMELEVTSKQT